MKFFKNWFQKKKQPKGLHVAAWIIFLQALIAMLGSLYYSNFGDIVMNIMEGEFFHSYGGYDPCHLCWWARILMYPIVAMGFAMLVQRKYNYVLPILLLALPGVGLEIYHYALQMFPIETSELCTMVNPCDAYYIRYWGFATIPFQCLVAFVVISISSIYIAVKRKK